MNTKSKATSATDKRVAIEHLLAEAMAQKLPSLSTVKQLAIVTKRNGSKIYDFGNFQITDRRDGRLSSSEHDATYIVQTIRKFDPRVGETGRTVPGLSLEVVPDLIIVAQLAARVVMDEDALLPARYTAKVLCEVMRQVMKNMGLVDLGDPRFLLLIAGVLFECLRLERSQDLALTEKRSSVGRGKGIKTQKRTHQSLWAKR